MSTSREEGVSATAEARASLHRLIDTLRANDVPTAQRILEALNATSDPLLTALMTAPVDDEPETDEERAAVAEALRDLEEGRVTPHQEVMRRLGLK